MNDDFDPNCHDKHHEGIMVLDADTVVDPWAVMVESLDTSVADGTMTRPGCLDYLALGAEISRIDISKKFQERSSFFWHYDTSIFARGIEECKEHNNC